MTVTADTTAPPAAANGAAPKAAATNRPPTWRQREIAALAQIERARDYLRLKREGKWRPPTPTEDRSDAARVVRAGTTDGTRGGQYVRAHFDRYMSEIDKVQQQGIDRFGGSRPYPVMTAQQRAEAAEWAVRAIPRRARAIATSDRYCDWGVYEIAYHMGTGLPSARKQYQFQVMLNVVTEQDVPHGHDGDTRTAITALRDLAAAYVVPVVTEHLGTNGAAQLGWLYDPAGPNAAKNVGVTLMAVQNVNED